MSALHLSLLCDLTLLYSFGLLRSHFTFSFNHLVLCGHTEKMRVTISREKKIQFFWLSPKQYTIITNEEKKIRHFCLLFSFLCMTFFFCSSYNHWFACMAFDRFFLYIYVCVCVCVVVCTHLCDAFILIDAKRPYIFCCWKKNQPNSNYDWNTQKKNQLTILRTHFIRKEIGEIRNEWNRIIEIGREEKKKTLNLIRIGTFSQKFKASYNKYLHSIQNQNEMITMKWEKNPNQ